MGHPPGHEGFNSKKSRGGRPEKEFRPPTTCSDVPSGCQGGFWFEA